MDLNSQTAASYGYGGQSGNSPATPREQPVSHIVAQQIEDLTKAEEALRAALNRLRGPRPEAVQGATAAANQIAPSLTDRLYLAARLGRSVAAMAGELAERLAD